MTMRAGNNGIAKKYNAATKKEKTTKAPQSEWTQGRTIGNDEKKGKV